MAAKSSRSKNGQTRNHPAAGERTRKAAGIRGVSKQLTTAFARDPDGVAFAPGRVNLIGEHTDYNDGFVLPMAIDRGVAVAFARRDDDTLRVVSPAFGSSREVSLAGLRARAHAGPEAFRAVPGWFSYVTGVAWAMSAAGAQLRGCDLAIAGDLPMGAGLSSSAALSVAIARALTAVSGIVWSPRDAARAAQRAEHVFVGVHCGIMDPLVCAAASEGSALLIDCRSLETRDVSVPSGARIVVVDTGVGRTLAASQYNERRAECAAAVAALQKLDSEVRALRDVDDALLARGKAAMHPVTFRRALHVVSENYRPTAFADALARGDLGLAGLLMRQSHASLRDLYEVSSEELDTVVDLAAAHPACYGARMTGAGFGGCAIALTSADIGDLPERIMDGYRERTGREAHVFVTRPSAGARLMQR